MQHPTTACPAAPSLTRRQSPPPIAAKAMPEDIAEQHHEWRRTGVFRVTWPQQMRGHYRRSAILRRRLHLHSGSICCATSPALRIISLIRWPVISGCQRDADDASPPSGLVNFHSSVIHYQHAATIAVIRDSPGKPSSTGPDVRTQPCRDWRAPLAAITPARHKTVGVQECRSQDQHHCAADAIVSTGDRLIGRRCSGDAVLYLLRCRHSGFCSAGLKSQPSGRSRRRQGAEAILAKSTPNGGHAEEEQ